MSCTIHKDLMDKIISFSSVSRWHGQRLVSKRWKRTSLRRYLDIPVSVEIIDAGDAAAIPVGVVNMADVPGAVAGVTGDHCLRYMRNKKIKKISSHEAIMKKEKSLQRQKGARGSDEKGSMWGLQRYKMITDQVSSKTMAPCWHSPRLTSMCWRLRRSRAQLPLLPRGSQRN